MAASITSNYLLSTLASAGAEWITAREVQRILEERGKRVDLSDLIMLAEQLQQRNLLEVIFISPGSARTGFASRLTSKGRAQVRDAN